MVLAVAALSPAAASGAANGTDRPLSGTVTATAHDNLSTGTSTADGTFLFTHLGKGTFHEDATAGPITGNTFTSTGTATYVAANGDKLFATITVTGTFTTARVGVIVSVVFVPGVGVIVTDTFTGTAVGQISY